MPIWRLYSRYFYRAIANYAFAKCPSVSPSRSGIAPKRLNTS